MNRLLSTLLIFLQLGTSAMALDRPKLEALLTEAKRLVEAMSPEQKDAMLRAQAESWARAEASWPRPRFHYVNGIKVYDSFEDYRND